MCKTDPMNEVSHNGDPLLDAIPSIKQKALRINLNENIAIGYSYFGGRSLVGESFYNPIGSQNRKKGPHAKQIFMRAY